MAKFCFKPAVARHCFLPSPLPSQPGATRHRLPRKCAVPRKCDPLVTSSSSSSGRMYCNVGRCRRRRPRRSLRSAPNIIRGRAPATWTARSRRRPLRRRVNWQRCLQATGASASRCERIVADLPAYKDCALSMSLRCFCEASAVFRRLQVHTCTCQRAIAREPTVRFGRR